MGNEWGTRTRFNSLSQIKTLFIFARARGYYAREEDALAGVEFAKGKGGEIGIFSPSEMRRLLAVAKPEIVPFLAIGAFAGLRTAEITRLDWSKVNLAKRFIEVTAQSAKTASRRIVPMADNLAAWLAPYAKTDGPVCATCAAHAPPTPPPQTSHISAPSLDPSPLSSHSSSGSLPV